MPRTRSGAPTFAAPDRLPDPPRRLRPTAAAGMTLRRAVAQVPALVGAIFLLVGTVLTTLFVPLSLRDRTLSERGVRADAMVVGRRAETRRDSDGDRDVRVYLVQYEFVLADGRTWAAERALSPSIWNTLDVGDRIEVRYAPDDPARHVLPEAGAGLPLVGVLFPLLFVGLGAFLVRRGLPEILAPARLYRTGLAAQGRITGVEEIVGQTVNGRHPLRIRYAFSDPDGVEHDGATATFDRALAASLAPDAPATVLYAADDPRRSVLLAALGLGGAPDARAARDHGVAAARSR